MTPLPFGPLPPQCLNEHLRGFLQHVGDGPFIGVRKLLEFSEQLRVKTRRHVHFLLGGCPVLPGHVGKCNDAQHKKSPKGTYNLVDNYTGGRYCVNRYTPLTRLTLGRRL